MHASPAPKVRAAVIVNPTKIVDFQGLAQRVKAAFDAAGWAEPVWYETTPTDSGFGQTKAAVDQGMDVVVACGGDGTVRECVRALCGSDVALGILPAGTGNLLAHAVGIPLTADGALDVVTGGHRRRIDVGQTGDKAFLVMAGMGFDAEMVGDASETLKARLGIAAYVWTALHRLVKKPMRVLITLDDKPPLGRYARCVVVGKVGRLPGGIQLMDVEADDGRLALAIISANRLTHWLKIVWALVTRRSRVPRVETHRASRVRIEATSLQRRQVDGDELEAGTTLDAHVMPGALLLCAPETAR